MMSVRILAVAALAGLGGCNDDPPARAQTASTGTDGRALYMEHCASCHGAKLEGEPNWRQRKADGTLPAPPHDASGHTWHHADSILFAYTKYGGQEMVGGNFKSAMPGFKDVMSDAQIRAVLDYIKSQWPETVRDRQSKITKAVDGG